MLCVGVYMSEVVWSKIAESGNGFFSTYFSCVGNVILIKNIEKLSGNEKAERLAFIEMNKNNACDFEFEEL